MKLLLSVEYLDTECDKLLYLSCRTELWSLRYETKRFDFVDVWWNKKLHMKNLTEWLFWSFQTKHMTFIYRETVSTLNRSSEGKLN